ncbi:MAG: hypothetical protein MRY49_00385 [Candidatus Pacebacteria bacterium]|nr:hypothetical protein [Candidatus Paceibacterota bacterium]
MGETIFVLALLLSMIALGISVIISLSEANVKALLSAGVSFVLLVVLSLSPLYLEYSKYDRKLLSFDERGELIEHTVAVFESVDYFCLPTSKFRQDPGREYSLYLTGTVTPITVNPKARTVTYKVVSEVVDPNKFFSYGDFRKKTVKETVDEINWRVNYWIQEFNNAKSKEVAEFYNPYDMDQVLEFRMLVQGYMNEKLSQTGIQVFLVEFSVK